MTDPCPKPLDPNKLNIDLSQLGNQLLIKKHEVRDDAEIVTMRDFKDLREGLAIGSANLNCDQRDQIVENLFRYGARTQQYRGCE